MTGQFTPTPSAQNGTVAFTGTGAGASFIVRGGFNINLLGAGVGTCKLQKSYDNANWADVSKNVDGDVLEFVKLTGTTISLLCEEPEEGVRYRWNCTAYTSGTISARISQ